MFRQALDYPTRPPHGGRSVLIGGALLLVVAVLVAAGWLGFPYAAASVLAVAPWLLVRGYYVGALRAAVGRGTPSPPVFDEYGRLLGDGARAAAISLAYLLPALAVLSPLAYLRFFLERDLAAILVATGLAGGVVAGIVSAVGVIALFAAMYLLGALYALPVAVALFAHAGRVRAAFDVRTVVAGATTEDYVVAWFVSLLLQLLLYPVAYLLRILVVGFFLQFLAAVAVRYCYGRGVGAALDLGAVVDEPAVEGFADDEPDVDAARDAPVRAVREVDESEYDWRD